MSADLETPPHLRSDCTNCFGLCCVLAPFSASQGFGVDKPSGVPCLNLADDDRCTIHDRLRTDGWTGCTVFECFGAGQQVSQVTYAGRSWREHDNLAETSAVFSVMRLLHEMLAHLTEARHLSQTAATGTWIARIDELRSGTPEELLTFDLDALLDDVGHVLSEASASVRRHDAEDLGRSDLVGADLRHRDLDDANLRGALLIGADLRGMRLGRADLLGADLRDVRLEGTDLAAAIFLTQPQINAARGDAATQIPAQLDRPTWWPLREGS